MYYVQNIDRPDLTSVIQASKLSKASSYFFVFGFVVSKIQYLPIAIFSSIFNLISLGLYFMGYGLWFIGSHFQPSQKEQKEEWYGFAQFKEQYLYASALGLIASIIGISAIFYPVLLVPAAWLFLTSNSFWTTGEYHKFKNPPVSDENYSHSYQDTYLSYAITMTAITLTTALSTTIIFIFPPITIPVLIVSSLICSGLGILAAEYWLNAKLGDHKKTTTIDHSYGQMKEALGPSLSNQAINTPSPYHGTNLLRSNQVSLTKNETTEPDLSIESCTLSQ